MKRREFMTLISGVTIIWPLAIHAQQRPPAPLKRIGVLERFPCQLLERWWLSHLAKFGWTEEQLGVECVSTVGRAEDLIPGLAHELVSRRPDVLITSSPLWTKALKQETTTIPIVMFSTTDPVRMGIVTNLARPTRRTPLPT